MRSYLVNVCSAKLVSYKYFFPVLLIQFTGWVSSTKARTFLETISFYSRAWNIGNRPPFRLPVFGGRISGHALRSCKVTPGVLAHGTLLRLLYASYPCKIYQQIAHKASVSPLYARHTVGFLTLHERKENSIERKLWESDNVSTNIFLDHNRYRQISMTGIFLLLESNRKVIVKNKLIDPVNNCSFFHYLCLSLERFS